VEVAKLPSPYFAESKVLWESNTMGGTEKGEQIRLGRFLNAPLSSSSLLWLLWPPYVIGQAIIFLPCGFFFYLLSFFPRLFSAVADWMSTILAHMVWP